MPLITVDLHGQVLQPGGLTPAVGTVRFRILQELRDPIGNVVYTPDTFTATLDVAGEFTISAMPTTDNPDIIPVDWVYEVWVDTDVWKERFYVLLPESLGPTAEFSDLPVIAYNPCTGTAATTTGTVFGSYLPLSGGTIAGNLTVAGTTTIRYGAGFTVDAGEMLSTVASTGVVSGGEINIDVNPARISLGPTVGYIVDTVSDQLSPTIIRVTLPAQIVAMDAGALSRLTTWWLADSAGTIIQQSDRPTPEQRRTHLVLGSTAQNGGTIFLAESLPGWINSQPGPQVVDLMDALGPFSITGNTISPNGVNLSFNKAAGTLFARAFSYFIGPVLTANPHEAVLPAQTPVTCRRATATDVLPALETLIDVANYDPGGLGVLAPVGGGANQSTNFRVWAFATTTVTDQMAIQYGQATYSSLAAAVAAVGTSTYIPNPRFVDGAFLGWISVIRTATNLSDPLQAVFTKAGKFENP